MVAILAQALRLTQHEQDRLLLAAGFAPRISSHVYDAGLCVNDSDLRMKAFEAAVFIAGATSAELSNEIAATFLGEIGIGHFVTGTLRPSAKGWQIRRDIGGRPAVGWLRHNHMNRYRERDYLVQATATLDRCFFWSDIPPALMSDDQRLILAEAGDFRIGNGFVLPIPFNDGSVRALSSWAERIEADIVTRMAASLVARALLERLNDIGCEQSNDGTSIQLSGEHRHLLAQIAHGEPANVIADRMALNDAELSRVVQEATRSMGSSSPVQAAAKAMSLGLLSG
jgi:hypothetical protein